MREVILAVGTAICHGLPHVIGRWLSWRSENKSEIMNCQLRQLAIRGGGGRGWRLWINEHSLVLLKKDF